MIRIDLYDITCPVNNAGGVRQVLTQTHSLLSFVHFLLRLSFYHRSTEKAKNRSLSPLNYLVLFLFLKMENQPEGHTSS